ncbi:sugar kinase [Streptomyces sp. CB01635]|uniref:ROK family transcriptional regulator n=1 Tax=unclassified Streptomyces TaxID=2593676 RepID=UPI000C27188E|nr:ROK family protein [Streptomyces sp. CB01635]PJN13435.1 sugar kinase [Streptomyces sp. CB01635]
MAGPRRRTVRDLRRNNRATVLRKLYFDGPLSRQELGPLTALSSGSISNVVSELVADGLLEEAGSVDSDGGRPRTLLRVAPHCGHLAGVDIGETRVRVELFDFTLNELARVDAPLPDGHHDARDVVRIVAAGLAQVLAEAKVAPDALIGVGIGVPGIVDASGAGGAVGAVVHGQAIGWDAVPLEAMLRDCGELPPELPLFVDNGAKTLGLAEMWFGAGRGARNAVVTLIGSGVGACVIADGVPYQGSSGSAGEWGHTTLQVGGRRCRCGARGCLEAYVGAEALLERWRESGGHPTSADEEGALAELLAAPEAAELLDETAEFLGAGIADLVNLFNPERIVVGGWAGLLLGSRLLEPVRRAAAAYALRHPYAQTTIELGRLGPDAVTVGAATLPLARFLAEGGASITSREPIVSGAS